MPSIRTQRMCAPVRVRSEVAALRGALRGGNWTNGTNAGVFALNLNNAPSNYNVNIGFRCSKWWRPMLLDGIQQPVLYH